MARILVRLGADGAGVGLEDQVVGDGRRPVLDLQVGGEGGDLVVERDLGLAAGRGQPGQGRVGGGRVRGRAGGGQVGGGGRRGVADRVHRAGGRAGGVRGGGRVVVGEPEPRKDGDPGYRCDDASRLVHGFRLAGGRSGPDRSQLRTGCSRNSYTGRLPQRHVPLLPVAGTPGNTTPRCLEPQHRSAVGAVCGGPDVAGRVIHISTAPLVHTCTAG